MPKIVDLSGNRYGRLTVIGRAPNNGRYVCWTCKCDCGNTTICRAGNLQSGMSKSCGCLQRERTSFARLKHGASGTRLYRVWSTMKARCFRESDKHYQWYGARGITVCDEWKNDYESFARWSYENRYSDSAPYGKCTLDRIDVNGNYCPENCRWVTMAEQNQNKRAKNGYKIKEDK